MHGHEGTVAIKMRAMILFLCVISWPVNSETFVGAVIKVADGDTITISNSNSQKVRVRLSGIDAPESKQIVGKQAAQYLTDIILGRTVTVEYEKLDRYGRVIGVVLLDGQDVNYQVIKAGFAWHYKKYQNEQTSEARKLYSEGEKAARIERVGIWANTAPTPPWVWRSMRRQ